MNSNPILGVGYILGESMKRILIRNPYVVEYAKRRANGICELCGEEAPFTNLKGEPYLEVHHIVLI